MATAERATVASLASEFRAFVEEEKKGHGRIQEQIEALTKAIQDQSLVEAGRKHLLDRIETHHTTLYGDANNRIPGHEQRISRLENQMSTMIKMLWIVVTPLLLAIGSGVVFIITQGVK